MSEIDDFAAYFANSWLGKEVEIIDADRLTAAEAAVTPSVWLDLMGMPRLEAMRRVLDMWQEVVPGRFPRLCGVIERYGWAVYLARLVSQPEAQPVVVLLYVFRGDVFSGGFDTRIGFPPCSESAVPEFWLDLPDGVRRLYEQVHDGFLTNPWAGPAGLIRSKDMFRFGEEFDQGDFLYYVMDDLGKAIRDSSEQAIDPDPLPDLDNLIGLCKNRGTARVLFDITKDDRFAWERWEGSLELWPNLWDRLDAWLFDSFDELRKQVYGI